MKKKFKQISMLVCAFALSVCCFGMDYSEAASKEPTSAVVYINNVTETTATVQGTLKSTGKTSTQKISPNKAVIVTINNLKKSDNLTVTFTNGNFANGKSAPTKSFTKTITVKPGNTYYLTPKTKTKLFTGASAGYVSNGNYVLKSTYKYGYKF